jgi:hypothetical protein
MGRWIYPGALPRDSAMSISPLAGQAPYTESWGNILRVLLLKTGGYQYFDGGAWLTRLRARANHLEEASPRLRLYRT